MLRYMICLLWGIWFTLPWLQPDTRALCARKAVIKCCTHDFHILSTQHMSHKWRFYITHLHTFSTTETDRTVAWRWLQCTTHTAFPPGWTQSHSWHSASAPPAGPAHVPVTWTPDDCRGRSTTLHSPAHTSYQLAVTSFTMLLSESRLTWLQLMNWASMLEQSQMTWSMNLTLGRTGEYHLHPPPPILTI